jgi:glycosyltransferase involved in cell wall biosynthesis
MGSEYPIRRHCMVVHAYYPLGETRVEREALALRDRGVEVDVVCLRKPGEPREDVIDGVTVYRVPISRRKRSGILVQSLEYLAFFVMALGRVTYLHLRRRYAVVQVHNLPDFLVFTALVPRLMGARVILDLHDLMPEFYTERFGRGMNSPEVRLLRAQEWISCKFADHIITVTDLWRQALVERGQPGQKITVVMNVADERAFNPSVVPDHTLERRSGFRLIYHGNIDQRYGLDLAVHAIDRIRRELPDVHLTVHGGGEYREVIEAMVEKAELWAHVEISREFVPTPVLAKRIKAADLGIVPYRDGVFTGAILPTKLMEYAALGLPVIAARTPTISRYFDDSMVEFFPPGDIEGLATGILRLYHDRERLGELARNISAFTRQWPWRRQRAAYVDLVDRLTDAARRGPRRAMVPRGGMKWRD